MPNNARTGVFPCYENQFAIGAAGGNDNPTDTIANCEDFSVAFDNGVEEWHPFEEKGWVKRMLTAKSVTLTVSGKRTIGDPGNDMVSACSLASGTDAERDFLWTFPSGATLLFKNAVINVTADSSGTSTNVGPLEFQVMSNGKPVFTPAA